MLTGQYAANFVQGLQGLQSEYPAAKSHGPIDSKDGLANSLDSWNGHTRHNFDAQVPLNDLADYYLPSFKACVMEGKSRGIMCSYNAVNSVPMW
jgi:beta-D-xylosidase 4